MSLVRHYPQPAPPDLSAMLAAAVERAADQTAFIDVAGSVSWREFDRLVTAAAAEMSRRGVAAGDRLALLADNGVPFTVVVWATWRLGALIVPLNHRLRAADLTVQLLDCGASMLLAGTSKLALAHGTLDSFPSSGEGPMLVPQQSWPGFFDLGDAVAGNPLPQSLLRQSSPSSDQPVAILYTSGTTGKPKGVVVSHDNVIQNSITCTDVIGRRSDTVELIMVPQFNVTGLCSQTVPVVSLGATAVLLDRFDEDRVVELIRRYQVTSTVGPPTMWWRILSATGAAGLPSLRLTLSGGAPMSTELLEGLARTCPGASFGNGYGLTETCSMVTYLDGATESAHLDSIGVPLPVTDIKIIPVEGSDAGELAVRGPQVALGYWRAGEILPLVDEEGWLLTGDAVRLDDGHLVLAGRLKDVIKRGGESIFAVEVEGVLSQHPDVLEAALVGVPDHVWGQLALAVLVPRDGRAPDEAEVLAFCRGRLAPFKIPAYVRFSAELPRNAGGKVIKAVLAEEFSRPASDQLGVSS